tara:strand:+ start:670 stop:1929 length:1260 start_codon:yes stop_codon:yes gene_type:complete
MLRIKNIYLLPIITLISLLLGIYLGEDTLGAGKEDYQYHIKYFLNFSESFYKTYNEFGLNQESSSVRNSPIFYMFFSLFLKLGISLENLKFINLLIIIPLFIFFFKCLEIKYSKINLETKLILSSILFLSPTIRTLLIWPYPLIWALCFFLISLYFFLIFEKTKNFNNKIKFAYLNLIFLTISAYFTPNFSLFSIFFFYRFFLFYKFKKQIFVIILINLILASPAIYFFISKDYYLFNSTVGSVDNYIKYNLSNKIIIISSMCFLFFLPYIQIKKLLHKINKDFKINNTFFILLFFIFINLYFYNFDLGPSNSGGGIFYHLSKVLFNNSLILFLVFFFSIYLFKYINLYNFNNILLFFILVFYNLQFTIYYKYFDPLIFFIFLFMIKLNNFNIVKVSKKYYLLYLIFLVLNFSKKFLVY